MKENSIYDKKSLRAVTGKNADLNELAKDCVAFSNSVGGNIDIGIEDTERMPPANQVIPDDLCTDIVNKISGRTHGVVLTAEIEFADNGGQYIRLSIPRTAGIVATTSSGKTFIRIGDQSRPVGPEDFARLVEDKGALRWEDTKTSFSWNNADTNQLARFLTLIKNSSRVSPFVKQKETKDLLDYFYMTDPESDKMTNLGVLFIGKQTQRGRLQNAPVIQCIKYDQSGDKIRKWLWDDFSKSPYEMVDDIMRDIPDWQESTEISDGVFRRDIPSYPKDVVRELLVNSLVHRPYTIMGDIFINIYPDHFEIVNPGLLPLGVTAENILHMTKKRNEHMCSIFYALHMMEREGSGYDMMYEKLLLNGKAVPEVEEGDDWVKVKVFRRIVNEETIKVMEYASRQGGLKQKQLICLGLIANEESISGKELISRLSLKKSDDLRSWLKPLVEYGFIKTNDEKTRAVEYRVAPDILKGSEYKGKTSLKRIENYRIKALIIEDLKIYHNATLTDIQKRIGPEISRKRIWSQLQILSEEQTIRIIGKRRWTQYELTNP